MSKSQSCPIPTTTTDTDVDKGRIQKSSARNYSTAFRIVTGSSDLAPIKEVHIELSTDSMGDGTMPDVSVLESVGSHSIRYSMQHSMQHSLQPSITLTTMNDEPNISGYGSNLSMIITPPIANVPDMTTEIVYKSDEEQPPIESDPVNKQDMKIEEIPLLLSRLIRI